MMQTLRKLWGGILGLGIVLFLGLGALPVKAEEMQKSPVRGSDYLTFSEELRTGGAIKFYEDTEEIVRAGKFERAYMRYIFLHAHIRGRNLDAGLIPMVDQRLRFLKEQMHLGGGFTYAAPAVRVKRRPAKPACPPENKEAKPAKPSDEEKPPPVVLPPAVPADQEQKPESPDTKEDKPSPGEAQKPSPDDQKPATPPSTWERLKRRMKFWQKDGGG
jgi:hypothetical protein